MAIIGLASWRMAHLLIYEDGPFEIIEKFRNAIGLGPGEVKGFLPLLFSCMLCLTAWTTIAAYLLYLLEPIATMLVAAMAVALLVDKVRNG